MTAAVRAEIYRENASHSTGPITEAGKQRASMNAFKHGLTGQCLILQPHEQETYNQLTAALNAEHRPQTESERQLVQHIIDSHTRLHRIAAIENNLLNSSLDEDLDDPRSQSWLKHSVEIDRLGRYESRITRQLLQYTKELARLQKERVQLTTNKRLKAKSASFRKDRNRQPAGSPGGKVAQVNSPGNPANDNSYLREQAIMAR